MSERGDESCDRQQNHTDGVGHGSYSFNAGVMNRSVEESNCAVLAVSQFTLHGDARRGRRPSYIAAAAPERAEDLYRGFVDALRARGLDVKEGVFQAHMQVELVNDGPVTILLDSERQF